MQRAMGDGQTQNTDTEQSSSHLMGSRGSRRPGPGRESDVPGDRSLADSELVVLPLLRCVCVCASPSSMLLLLRSSFWLVLTTLAASYATPPLCGTATASTMLSVHVPCPGPRGQVKNQPPRLDSYFSMEPAASRGVLNRDISPFQRG